MGDIRRSVRWAAQRPVPVQSRSCSQSCLPAYSNNDSHRADGSADYSTNYESIAHKDSKAIANSHEDAQPNAVSITIAQSNTFSISKTIAQSNAVSISITVANTQSNRYRRLLQRSEGVV